MSKHNPTGRRPVDEFIDYYSKIHKLKRPQFEQREGRNVFIQRNGGAPLEFPMFPFCRRTLLNKLSTFYGRTRAGKTTAIRHATYAVSDAVAQVYLLSPSEPNNNNFKGIVPPWGATLIDVDPKAVEAFLTSIWNNQTEQTAVYSRANDPVIIDSLYGYVRSNVSDREISKVKHIIADMEKKKTALGRYPQDSYTIESCMNIIEYAIEDKYRYIQTIKKSIITAKMDVFDNVKLNEDQKFTLMHMNINPNTLLIIDDAMAELKKVCTKPWFIRMFTRGRQCNLTVFIAAHADTDLSRDLRESVFNSIFCALDTLRINIDRGGAWSKEEIANAEYYINKAKSMGKNVKIVLVRDSICKLRYAEATKYSEAYDVGSSSFWNFLYNAQLKNANTQKNEDDLDPAKYKKIVRRRTVR